MSADGRCEVLGCAVGDSETEGFWTEFLRGLRERGLHGVQVVRPIAPLGRDCRQLLLGLLLRSARFAHQIEELFFVSVQLAQAGLSGAS